MKLLLLAITCFLSLSAFATVDLSSGETRTKKLSGPHNGDYMCDRNLQADSRCR